MTGTYLRRRSFLALAGSAALLRPVPLFAQAAMPVIGLLGSGAEASFRNQSTALTRGLRDSGFVVGQNVRIEYRWAENQYERLQAMAAELVRLPVAVIVAAGGNIAAIIAKAATSTIPIVFTGTADPVTIGLVASLNRPGGNITGISIFSHELDAKRLELLRELVPTGSLTGILINPANPNTAIQAGNIERAAAAMGRKIILLRAQDTSEIETAFARLVETQATGLVVGADPFFTNQRNQVVALAARFGIPAIYQWREFVTAGGLISYGPSITNGYYQGGLYVGRILKGEKPADLPVLRPSQIELAINLATAKMLGLAVPPSVLARADEVIE